MHSVRHRFLQTHAAISQDVSLTRACIGVLGLFPMITAVLVPALGSVAIAIVVAAIGAVTFMAMLPRRRR
jgi:hypothetical protein